jgi:alpha-tubulin suppressor-like RCC1 family protein
MALHIQQIACGGSHSLALLSDGSVWAVGSNTYGQLGDGTKTDKTIWALAMPVGSGVIQIAAGSVHSLALKSDGSVCAVGGNTYGHLGDGTTAPKATWTPVLAAGSGVIQVAVSQTHSLVLKSDGSVWATGMNNYGQLGDGTTKDKTTWISVIPSGVIQVAAGGRHSLALKSDGSVWATGYNVQGQLGDGTRTNKSTWTSVIPSGATQVAGVYHSLVLKSDGSVWAAGYNGRGQLGDGTVSNKSTWTSVIPSGVTQVAAGAGHSLVLKSNGSVWATGRNSNGQLGNGTASDQSTWTSVMASGMTRLAAGHSHSLALKSDGTLWKTGNNEAGQLGHEGDGSTVWIPDRFFETLLLESLLSQSGDDPDVTTGSADDWRELSL